MKYVILLFLFILLSFTGFAQQSYSPRDTSYSIYSSYLKIKKTHPDVHPIWSDLPKCVQTKSNLVYANIDDTRPLHLDVFYLKKKKRKKRPAILMIHGGGWTTGSKENLIPMAQQLAEKGYVTVTVEYRLSAEARYPAGIFDLKTAVRWMRANADEFGIDTTKIAAYGASAGAHLASFLGTTNGLAQFEGNKGYREFSSDIQAVLNIDGIVSFIHPDAEPEWTGYSANQWLDSYETNFERWKEASPLEYAGSDTPPFLFVNSSFPRFHAGRDDLIDVLDKNGIFNEVHTFDDTPHAFWLLYPWFEPTLEYSLGFLKKVFK
ncbi:MAG: alpha/beta hydrolase [Chitinophagales bacterium]